MPIKEILDAARFVTKQRPIFSRSKRLLPQIQIGQQRNTAFDGSIEKIGRIEDGVDISTEHFPSL